MNIAIILGAGSGTRIKNSDVPKQFVLVGDYPLLIYSIMTFNNHEEIDRIVVVTRPEYIVQMQMWIEEYHLSKATTIVRGGNTRQESVYNALKVISPIVHDDDIVLIHDGARPLVSKEIIDNNIRGVELHDSCTTALRSVDTTISSVLGEKIDTVLNRKVLHSLQTPQSFRYRLIMDAHKHALENDVKDASDDTQIVLGYNHDVYLVEGGRLNFKVTTAEDLVLLKAIIAAQK